MKPSGNHQPSIRRIPLLQSRLLQSRLLQSAALGIGLALAAAVAQAQSFTGPQSSQPPYIVPSAPGWEVTALISAGDRARDGAYRMVGLPDGMGALPGRFAENDEYLDDKAYLTVFLNHELAAGAGAVRAHGQSGAFVSQWTLRLDGMEVIHGQDLITRVMTWDKNGYADSTGRARFNRFCSADLPARTAFFNPRSGKGFNGRIYLNGEEAGADGRAFATLLSGREKGTSYELPWLGRFSWENAVAHPDAGDKTLVVGLDDASPGQVYVYVGDKRRTGNAIERAGLQGGRLYGIKVTRAGGEYGGAAAPREDKGAIDGRFELVEVAAGVPGALLQAQSEAGGVTEFARPEDGQWDTVNPRVFYFATTGAAIGRPQSARLYKLSFDSLSRPTGGRIEPVIDSADMLGTDGERARSFDNLTVDGDGKLIIQEDPGGAYLAKIWKIDLATREYAQIFVSDRERFLPDGSNYLTRDEENSGVIEVTGIVEHASWYEPGRRYFLGATQAHYRLPGELVQGGQLYLMASPAVALGKPGE